MTQTLTLKEHFRRNILLAYPVVIGQLGHIMVSVADTVMVGRVGVIPLAAATFAGAFYHVLMVFGLGVSYAVTPLVAASDPTDQPRLMTYLRGSFLLNSILAILMLAIGFGVSFFLSQFGQEPEVASSAKDYLIIATASLVPVMIFQTFRQFSEGLSDTFNPMIASLVANLLNVLLNYVMIYGHWGVPAMGLNGAGYATLISRVIMVFLMWWMIRKKLHHFNWRFEWAQARKLLNIGIPSGMQYVFEVGAFATSAIMVGWISAEALAAHQIAINLAAITYMSATGIGAAATVRIGNQLGQKDLRNLRIAGYSCFVLVAVFMAISAVLFVIFRYPLTSLYVSDPAVQSLAAGLLIIAAAFQLSDGLQAVGLGVLRGLTDVKVPTVVTFIAYWVLALPGGYLLGFVFDLGVDGIWYALSGGLTVAAVLHIWRFNRLTQRIRF